MKKVMFVPFHFPQGETCKPLVNELLRNDRDVSIYLLDLHPKHQGIAALQGINGQKCKFIEADYARQMFELLHTKHDSLSIKYYTNLNNELSLAKKEVDGLLDDILPDVIVLFLDGAPLFKDLIESASKRGIPTLLVQEGIINRWKITACHWTFYGKLASLRTQALRGLRNMVLPNIFKRELYGHGGCTKIAVWGNYIKNLLTSEGVESSRIVITGSPRYDKLISNELDAADAAHILKIPAFKRIILYIDQRLVQNRIFTKNEAYSYTRSIFEAAAKIPNVQLIVKVRKGSGVATSVDLAKKVIKDIDAENVIITDLYLYELLKLAGVVIIFTSTVGYEALIFDKPVISVNFAAFEPYPYIESGAALGCRSPHDILPAIERALFDTSTQNALAMKRKEFIAEHLYRQDGKASLRISRLIRQLMEKNVEIQ